MDGFQTKTRVSRKERRKEERKQKKVNRNIFFTARKNFHKKDFKPVLTKDNNEEKKSKQAVSKKKKNPKISTSESKLEDLNTKMKTQRKRRLIEDNEKEDMVIKRLEKKLKLNKRSTKSVPKSFVESGLDYILDVCDSEKVKDVINDEGYLLESDSDFSDDFVAANSTASKGNQVVQKKVVTKSDGYEDNIMDEGSENDSSNDEADVQTEEESDGEAVKQDDSEISDYNSANENDEMDTDSKKINSNNIGKQSDEEGCWEDIYGRIRTKEGNIRKDSNVYVPPHLRNINNNKSEEFNKLKREVKGFLNKLTSANLNSISLRIEDLYNKHSRNSINQTLFDLSVDAVVQTVLVKEQLVLDHAMLFTVLHANVGSEVGAFLLTKFIEKFTGLYSPDTPLENKQLDNLLLLICQMFNFRIFDSCLIYDILKKITSTFKEKDVDLILVVLKSVGFLLRKDDPVSLKDFIISVQKTALQTSVEENSRFKFMIEVLMSVKNNNITKVSSYNPEEGEHLKKIVRSCIRKGNSVTQLNIGLEDILKVEERGRWWVVGSAWTGKESKPVKAEPSPLQDNFSSVILDLAKKQNMNTENRKNIFCILMTSDDAMDACEKVLRLSLKGQQEKEIAQIVVHCLLQEKQYNKYYFYVAEQLCSIDRRHKMSFQVTLWDKFKMLTSLSNNQLSILAKFLSTLLLSGSIALTVLKTLPFSELEKRSIQFLRRTFLFLFNDGDEEDLRKVFEKICKSKEQGLLRESLRLFLNHFILKRVPDGPVKQKIENIDNLLTELLL